jgi:membrane protein DedA with SNARE-associated domain
MSPEQVMEAPEVADIHAPHAEPGCQIAGWPGAQPFGFIAANMLGTLLTGMFLAFIGFAAKIITIKSRDEFIKDLGKIILMPGVIGVIGIIIIQLLTVNSINDLIA